MALLTDKTVFAATLADLDVIHIVDVSDTSSDPAGTSYKLTFAQLSAAIQSGYLNDRGDYDASVNAYPSTGGSGSGGAIQKGDIWLVDNAGILPVDIAVEIGDSVRALIDGATNSQTEWGIIQANVAFEPCAVYSTVGVPSYFPDLSTAIANVGTGGVVHLFADITEASIVMNKDMTIVCNGYKIISSILNTIASNVNIYNGEIIVDSVSAILSVNTGSVFSLNGTSLTNTTGDTMQVNGKVVEGTSFGTVTVSSTGELINHRAFTDNEVNPVITSGGTLKGCFAKSINGTTFTTDYIGIKCTAGTCDNSTGESEVGTGIKIEGDTILTNSIGKVTGSSGVYGIWQLLGSTGSINHCSAETKGSSNVIIAEFIYNSTGISETGLGLVVNVEASGCNIICSSAAVVCNAPSIVTVTNCTFIAINGIPASIVGTTDATFIGCVFHSKGNFSGSHGITTVNTATLKIRNSTIITDGSLAAIRAVHTTTAVTNVSITNTSFRATNGSRYSGDIVLDDLRTQDNSGNRNIL